jgi:hypothetical protein
MAKEMWVLTYLHDWEESGKVYPQVHAIYTSWAAAEAVRAAMIDPSKYWVVRSRIEG